MGLYRVTVFTARNAKKFKFHIYELELSKIHLSISKHLLGTQILLLLLFVHEVYEYDTTGFETGMIGGGACRSRFGDQTMHALTHFLPPSYQYYIRYTVVY